MTRKLSDAESIADEELLGGHLERARAIYRRHPEIKTHFGPNRVTFVWIVALVGVQFAAAKFASDLAWWVTPVAAYFVGAVVSHALFVLIHECCHNLVFRRPLLNRLAELVANLPFIVPCAASFGRAHREHHRHLGEYPDDPDVPSDWEAKLVGRSSWRKLLWLATYPIWLVFRSLRTQAAGGVDRWIALNVAVQIGVDGLLLWIAGPGPVLYLLLSTWFSVSVHPLGARWIQEHFMIAPPQRTYSYYGPLNFVAFNIGYHNEHHDFPRLPWNELPQLRRIGGAWYDELAAHRSWTGLLLRFLREPQFHLHRRMLPTAQADDAPNCRRRSPSGAETS